MAQMISIVRIDLFPIESSSYHFQGYVDEIEFLP